MMEDNTAQQQQQLPIPELMALLTSADSITDAAQCNAALIEALRTIRKQMDIAEGETSAAKRRLENAQQVYNTAAHYLAEGARDDRVVPLNHDVAVRTVSYNHAKSKSLHSNNNSNSGSGRLSSNKSYEILSSSSEQHQDPLPTNPIVMPRSYSSGGGMDDITLSNSNHRETFYQQLLGLPSSQVDQYIPNEKQPNLRSKSKLVEGMHIEQH